MVEQEQADQVVVVVEDKEVEVPINHLALEEAWERELE